MTTSPVSGDAPGTHARADVVRLALWLGALSLPALLMRGAIADAAAASSRLAASAGATPGDLLQAFVASPIVATSAGVLFLSPGLLLGALAGLAGRADRWLLTSFAISLVVVSLLAATGQWLLGEAFRGSRFGWAVFALSACVATIGAWRAPSAALAAGRAARATLVVALALPLALGVLFAPKLHWEALNGDGAHAFESSRLLLSRALPFWPPEAGHVAAFPGTTSMLFCFPASWFLRLFGELDATVRLPFLLYLSLALSALAWVVSAGRAGHRLPLSERLLIALAVVSFAVTMAWSATYSPYSADLALPAAQDTLMLALVLGFVASFVERNPGWSAAFALLAYLSMPSGLLLLAFWLPAILVTWRPVPIRQARWLVALLGALAIGGALLPRILSLLELPLPGGEYGFVGLLRYFAFLRLDDLSRFVWVALPCGIAPVAATLLWRRQDPVARSLSLLSAAYFLFVYVQANVSLHHFAPCMLLPVAVLWRSVPLEPERRRLWIAATAAVGLLALALVWPANAAPQLDGRRVGQSVWNRVGGYDRSTAESFAAAELLTTLFPLDWDPAVPNLYGGSPLVWHRYARGDDGPGVNYILQRAADPAPAGGSLREERAGFALYVRRDEVWEADRHLRPPTPAGSRWLAVPRSTLFRSMPPETETWVIDVARLLDSAGVPVDELLRRLGAKR